jgi:hypothetical protein
MGQAAEKLSSQGELLSISAIAKQLKLDRATVKNRLDDLGYKPDESSTAKNQLYLFTEDMVFEIKAAKDSLSAAKIRQTRAQAEKIEMQNAEARRELVPMHEAIGGIQKIIAAIYQEFKVQQPKRIAQKLAKAKNATEVKKILTTDASRIMKGIGDHLDRFLT